MKIAILGTLAKDTIIFRRDLILSLVKHQITVYVLCVDFDEESVKKIKELGAIPVSYSLNRAGLNPLADIKTILQLKNIFNKLKPDIVFSCFVKPSIYGSIAAHLANVPKRIAMLEGLGFVFTDLPSGISTKQKILRQVQIFLYRLALPSIDTLIFLNPDDPIDLLQKHNLKAKSVKILGGIGLNLDSYPFSVAQIEPISFIFVGRLLAEKGIHEYISAAKYVKNKYPNVQFTVLGGIDDANPGGLKQAELDKLLADQIVTYPGYVTNVSDWITKSSIFVLPSYREGVPRSTQEAMAIGRPIITTDVPGCRETVNDGVNGFLVPKWNHTSIAEKMIHFIENPNDIIAMGKESHRIATEKFDANITNKKLVGFIID